MKLPGSRVGGCDWWGESKCLCPAWACVSVVLANWGEYTRNVNERWHGLFDTGILIEEWMRAYNLGDLLKNTAIPTMTEKASIYTRRPTSKGKEKEEGVVWRGGGGDEGSRRRSNGNGRQRQHQRSPRSMIGKGLVNLLRYLCVL